MKDAKSQHRAAQVWSILVFAARHQEIVTYSTVGKLTGLRPYGLGTYLDMIADYCRKKKYPDLWSIVVNEKTGFPGTGGMEEGEELEILREQRRVFAFNWFSKDCPQAGDFK
jgi:hypothetical protein